jgi:hypothetical protein
MMKDVSSLGQHGDYQNEIYFRAHQVAWAGHNS